MAVTEEWAQSGRPTIEFSISEQDARRIRRTRKANLSIYFLIWLVFAIYAIAAAGSAATLQGALDQFLPLQIVVGLSATIVFVSGWRVPRRSILRRMSLMPVVFSTLILGFALVDLLGATMPRQVVEQPVLAPDAELAAETFLVSL